MAGSCRIQRVGVRVAASGGDRDMLLRCSPGRELYGWFWERCLFCCMLRKTTFKSKAYRKQKQPTPPKSIGITLILLLQRDSGIFHACNVYVSSVAQLRPKRVDSYLRWSIVADWIVCKSNQQTKKNSSLSLEAALCKPV